VKACLLIPIYNHKDEVGGVVEALEPAQLPCLIVDDGSNAATRAVLEQLAERYPWVSVHRRPHNGGRGAALKTGYRLAFEGGFSHALQLDADGQHDAADLARFLDEMQRAPEALVLGAPRFDESAPRSRLYGRQLSRVMVWLATLSFDVTDPLCGFRGIPLAATVALLDREAMGDHMEFDPQLVIRLHWSGIAVRNIPTRVVYRSGGLSHFEPVRDNLRLSAVYAVSLASALLRLPRRLVRGKPGAAEPETGR
jgi:glycosyltransferase involved in cell wall biosynthesis